MTQLKVSGRIMIGCIARDTAQSPTFRGPAHGKHCDASRSSIANRSSNGTWVGRLRIGHHL